MSSSRIDRALYGPSLFEVTFGAILSVLLGAILAIGYLVLKPVEVVKVMPAEDQRIAGATYFIEGSKDFAKGKQWMRKRQMLVESTPGQISLTEDELNTWFANGNPSQKTPAKAPAPKAPPSSAKSDKNGGAQNAEQPADLITWSELNFRIHDNLLQIGLPSTINLNLIAMSLPVIIQSDGDFEKRGDLEVYVPNKVLIGSLPLHRFPGVTEYLVKRALSSVPEDALNAWKKVTAAAIENKTLKLTVQ